MTDVSKVRSHECDRPTDGQTDTYRVCTASRAKNYLADRLFECALFRMCNIVIRFCSLAFYEAHEHCGGMPCKHKYDKVLK